ncbi:MAG: exo-alpha-sialidase [Pseudomonadota bacterium]
MPTHTHATRLLILIPLSVGGACDRQPASSEPVEPALPSQERPTPPRGGGEPLTAQVLERALDGQASDEEAERFLEGLRQRAPNAGPWHEDLFVATSPDGFTIDLSQARRIATAAAVPGVVRAPDGRLRLLFVDGDLGRAESVLRQHDPWMRDHGLIGFGAIDQLVSEDEGQTWQREPAFKVTGQVRGMVVDPEVHLLPDGRWRLYEIGTPIPDLLKPDSWADGVDHQVFSATSTDLVSWTMEGLVVTGPNADPAVFCDGQDCVMVSTGLDISRSTDGGRTFTFLGDFRVPGFAPAFLELPDRRVRLFYNSKDRGGPLRSMISADRGRTWEHEPGDRVPAYQLEAPAFLARPEGGWWVFYHYWQEGFSGDSWDAGYLATGLAQELGGSGPDGDGPGGRGEPPPDGAHSAADPAGSLERLVLGTALDADRAWASHHLELRSNGDGPWSTDIVLARSSDPLRFEAAPAAVVERAGQPELVRAPGGELLLFCVSGAIEEAASSLAAGWGWEGMLGMPGYGVLQLYASRDGGATWSRDRALTIDGLEPGMVRDPAVVALPAGGFRLYLVHLTIPELVERDAFDPSNRYRVITATSTDLRHWRLEGEAAQGPAAGPTVHCARDGACRLVYFGMEGGLSSDGGLSFALTGPGPDKGFGPELVALPGQRLRLYYNGVAEGAPLLSQLSDDGGATWAPEPGQRAAPGLAAPSVIPTPEGGWLMAAQRPRAERTEQGGPSRDGPGGPPREGSRGSGPSRDGSGGAPPPPPSK